MICHREDFEDEEDLLGNRDEEQESCENKPIDESEHGHEMEMDFDGHTYDKEKNQDEEDEEGDDLPMDRDMGEIDDEQAEVCAVEFLLTPDTLTGCG